MSLPPDEWIAFDMYFASLASMQVHPGAGTRGHVPKPLDDCAEMALEMLAIRRQVLGHNPPK